MTEASLRSNTAQQQPLLRQECHTSDCVMLCFLRVGGAAGTIAKSISAYDMSVSDSMYGACAR